MRSKDVTLNSDNQLANFVNLSLVGLRVIVLEEVSSINTFYRNKVILKMIRIEAIYRIT